MNNLFQMKHLFPVLPVFLLFACSSAPSDVKEVAEGRSGYVPHSTDNDSEIEQHYNRFKDVSGASQSTGNVGNGKLINGRIVPFKGVNFHYFDTTSYLKNRCFVHEKVLNTILGAYVALETTAPGIQFGLMECSRENGGKIRPHLTHQNGLSVDFMTPLLKDGKQCTDYDYTGAPHYFMEFDADGIYKRDQSVSIDFETMALHLLTLIEMAGKNGLALEKVILKLDLKDNLFATPSGKKLKASGVYFAQQLTPIINRLHDDHFHVDFQLR